MIRREARTIVENSVTYPSPTGTLILLHKFLAWVLVQSQVTPSLSAPTILERVTCTSWRLSPVSPVEPVGNAVPVGVLIQDALEYHIRPSLLHSWDSNRWPWSWPHLGHGESSSLRISYTIAAIIKYLEKSNGRKVSFWLKVQGCSLCWWEPRKLQHKTAGYIVSTARKLRDERWYFLFGQGLQPMKWYHLQLRWVLPP